MIGLIYEDDMQPQVLINSAIVIDDVELKSFTSAILNETMKVWFSECAWITKILGLQHYNFSITLPNLLQ